MGVRCGTSASAHHEYSEPKCAKDFVGHIRVWVSAPPSMEEQGGGAKQEESYGVIRAPGVSGQECTIRLS
jgi:hypothetical protein